ncbi:MAG: mechanosensitive ion channel [Gammaproteobacteria bacterium]|nr:mechanosensitive ion channel [Gammaproteobacteria bacterium]MYK36361.1 mechanosensitive ion channel [Gammaproteobacteria bacterium]
MEELNGLLQTVLDTVLSVVPSAVTLQESLLQLALAAVLCLGAWLIRRRMHPAIVDWCETRPRWESARRILEPLIWPLTWLVFLSLLLGLYVAAQQDTWLLEILNSLLVAWIVVRLVSRAIRNPMLSRITAVIAYGMAVLSIWDLLGTTIEILDGPNFTLALGEFSLSVYQVLATALLLAVLLSLAGFTSRVTERRLREADWLTPAGRVLLNKSLRIALFVFAILITIGSVGIDLTALAVVGGAVGFGIGFGLQKVFSNLISGVILLTDKSIKPGDVITVENTYGWVNKLGARYVSIITRDGIEHLIPNETMITEPVSNWTHSDANTRLRIPIGVHYDTDLEEATRLGVEAAKSQPRVLKDPEPRCLVKGFGESAIDLEIRFWIQDADSGVSNIKSAVILEVWQLYRDHGIKIPYPQRDLHIKSDETQKKAAG